MKLSIAEDGSLYDADGRVYGRVTSMEIEFTAPDPGRLTPTQIRELVGCPFCGVPKGEHCAKWGNRGSRKANHMERILDAGSTLRGDPADTGNSVVVGSTNVKAEQEAKASNKLSGEPGPAVQEVWGHYVKVFGATRMKLDEPRRRIIRNALKVRSVAECCKAIDGLYVSPFHNGDNDRRTKYLGIAYALKGRNGESVDERIDKMAELAPVNAGSSTIDPVKIERRLEAIRLNVRNAAFEPERAKEAKRQLEEWGFIVTTMKDPPFVELSRVAR